MKNSKVLMIILAVVLLSNVGCMLDFANFNMSGFKYKFDDSYRQDLEGAERVSIAIRNGKIDVSVWDKDEIYIEIEERIKADDNDEAEILAEAVSLAGKMRGDTLAIEIDYGDYKERRKYYACNLTVKVPARLAMKLSTTNGSLLVEDIEGVLEASTTNGSIEIDNAGDDLQLTSTNGRISIIDAAGEVRCRTTNGNIDVTGASKAVSASTTNGSIKVSLDQLNGSIDLGSTNGGIAMLLPEASSFSIKARTSNGRVSDSFDEARFEYNRRKNSMDGSYNGGDERISLRTTNGRISVEAK